VESVQHSDQPHSDGSAGTLGEVLYASQSAPPVPEADWVSLVLSISRGDQLALHALYERAHRVVFTLTMRISGSRESAEELTLDVFHDVWRKASSYDPVNGTVLGWIMNQARSRAIDRLRFEQRKKRVDSHAGAAPEAAQAAGAEEMLVAKQNGEALQAALTRLAPPEREAIQAAYFSGMTHEETAAALDEPLGTIKTRIRSGLQKLRQALNSAGRKTT